MFQSFTSFHAVRNDSPKDPNADAPVIIETRRPSIGEISRSYQNITFIITSRLFMHFEELAVATLQVGAGVDDCARLRLSMYRFV